MAARYNILKKPFRRPAARPARPCFRGIDLLEPRLYLDSTTGLLGAYFNNTNLTGTPLTQLDSQLNFTWPADTAPASGIATSSYGIRWTGFVKPQFTERYTFLITADDGVRLWVNGRVLVDLWFDHTPITDKGWINLTANTSYSIQVDYYNHLNGGTAKLQWYSNSQPQQIVPSSALLPPTNVPTPPIPTPVPVTPSNLTATLTANQTVALAWSDVANETGFQIERSTDNTNFTPLATIATGTLAYTDTTVIAGATYYYRLRATGLSGNSLFSTPASVTLPQLPPITPTTGTNGLLGSYYSNLTLTGTPLTQIDPTINMNWPSGTAPSTGLPTSSYSVRWTGSVTPLYTERYNFFITSDDGMRLLINGRSVVDQWYDHSQLTAKGWVDMVAGTSYLLTVEYYNHTAGGVAKLEWESNHQVRQIVPSSALTPPGTIPTPPPPQVPAAPTGLTAKPVSTSEIDLTWTDHATNETGYVVEASIGSSNTWTTAATLAANMTSWKATGLAASTSYSYRLRATGTSGDSLTTTLVTATTLAPLPPPPPSSNGTGLRGFYFNTMNLSGLPTTRLDSVLNFDWNSGVPLPALPVDQFSVRWLGQIQPNYSETYTFYTTSDDGVRLWINGQLLVDDWNNHAAKQVTSTITLAAGTKYDLKMEYFENSGNAVARLEWSSKSQARQFVPMVNLYPAVDPYAVTPLVPSGLLATPTSATQIGLLWTDQANNETGFILERSSDGAHFSPLITLAANTTTYLDTGLTPTATYYYRLAATNNYGTSLFTPAAMATTPELPPPSTVTHPEPAYISDFQTNMPANLVTLTATRRGNIFFQGEPITFTLTGTAATTYEVRDYNGTLVDSGPVTTAQLTPNISTLGWYKLYLYGNTTTATWGDVVGGTMFAIIRTSSTLPAPADLSNFVGDFVRPVLTRIDSSVAFDWGTGSPAANIQTDDFGAIWTGQIQPKYTETYTFYLQGDDRSRLYINGQKLIDYWNASGPAEATATITLQAGQRYDLRLEYFEWLYSASVHLSWSSPSQAKQLIPATALYPSAAATTPGGLTGNYYNVFVSPDSALDPVLHSVMGLGPERLAVQDASQPDVAIAQIQQYLNLYNLLYPNLDAAHPLNVIVAFPNGTTNQAGVSKIISYFKNSIKYWEPRNEPNYSASGADYTNNELIPFYNTVKAISPTLHVVGPAVVTIGPYGLQWLEGFFQAGGGRYLDAFSFHAYNNVNGDLALIRQSLDALKQILAKYNIPNIPIWQTEQGAMASVYGAYQPRMQARWTMLEQMVFAQYGIPTSQNAYWYDKDSGFRQFPMYWINQDGSINPLGPLMRVWSEELYDTTFTKAFDFGAANSIYLGSLFTGANGYTVAAFSAPGTPDSQIQLAVSGGSMLIVVSEFGVRTSIPVTNGLATLNITNVPRYVELAPGQTVDVIKPNWGPNLALQTGVTGSASGNGINPNGSNWYNPISKIFNGQIESWYWSQQPYADIWSDNTNGFPAWVQITLPTATTISRLVIYAGVPWQLRGSLLDYDVQALINGQWVTLQTTKVDPKTIGVFTPATQTTVDSFYDEQYVFINSFAPVVTSQIRLLVRDTTWGGGATELVKRAGGQTGYHNVQLAEVQIYGQ